MDATIAVQKFNDYTKTLGTLKGRLTDIINRINRVKPYLKDASDISDIDFMKSSIEKGQSIITSAYEKLDSINSFIDTAKEAIGLGHPFVIVATVAATILGIVGGLIYTVGKLTDTANTKLELIEKRVLPPEVLTNKVGFKFDLGPLRWLAYIGIGFIAYKLINR